MVNYQNDRIVIIGLGITGISCVKYFKNKGVNPWVMDTRFFPPYIKELPSDLPCCFGSLNKQWILNATIIVVSPGVSLLHPFLVLAIKSGIDVIGDIELFVREAKMPIVAITGSNGKSTVTKILSEMAISAGWVVGVGGNIGYPVLDLLNKAYKLYILELSSFQLETTYSLMPIAATILNISEDHIDRYPFGICQYKTVKYKIFKYSSFCIFNLEDNLTYPIDNKNCCFISFGINTGDYHLKEYQGQMWLMVYGELLLMCKDMKISGEYNYLNALAALALADVINIPRISSLSALRNFKGLAHRFELIHKRNNVYWINDSKATNIDSTKAALNRLKNIKGIIHLILGGDSKSANFSPLIPLLQDKRIKLYCFGKDGLQISFLSNCSIFAKTLEQVMKIISKKVQAGDSVLLSPACSSLDQFSSFEERGELFSFLAKKFG